MFQSIKESLAIVLLFAVVGAGLYLFAQIPAVKAANQQANDHALCVTGTVAACHE
jgi:hypothetical protein